MAFPARSVALASCLTYLYAHSAHATPIIRPDWVETIGATNFTSVSSKFSWTSVRLIAALDNIKPSPELRYSSCYDGFQCARLELPLNWNATGPQDPTYNETYNMAIIRLPAQVPVDDPRYGGPILINPGGPGASGVSWVESSGQVIQTIVDAAYFNGSADYVSDSPDARYFDIIGFDPRGVGNSTPYFTGCASPAQLQSWNMQYLQEQLNWPHGRLDELWKAWSILAVDCSWDPKKNPNGSKILDFASTAMTARDMVELVERHGEWREKQTKRNTDAKKRLRWEKGEEPIQFIGLSYGTVLGATLAAMQPHRVRRFLLDGVLPSSEYYSGEFASNSADSDLAMENFFSYCAMGGQDECALWAGNTSVDTRNRLRSILLDLEENGSVAVPLDHDTDRMDVISLGHVKLALSEIIYSPLTRWAIIANALAPLTQRNGTLMATGMEVYHDLPAAFDQYDPRTAAGSDLELLTWALISGGDSTLRFKTEEGFADHTWASLRGVTEWYGDSKASGYMVDALWPVTFDWRFGDKNIVGSNVTAHPVLFASNRVDGATSLASARKMRELFKDSRLLIVDGDGHTTHSAPSLCAAKAKRSYFQTGEMPDTSKPCLPARRPFGVTENTEKHEDLTKEEGFLWDAQLALAGL
ncbi:hypothetical protein PRZ48_015120 [Zasmidium cellare]|uniref:Peptidase S33 tripeptidyl aminopeptidase-like C-terminal domain-containing protein n=1 Tax=Zasmidium cellare TaxID=395010 RepID=A0ABR0DXW4_ZASCE|nr:hypothetical protein PRZ48_015120 [Zasmidium cellare]